MKKEYNVRRELKRLASIRGSGTELVSIYVPPGTQISDVTGKLRDEAGQASNIKSKKTRDNVTGAIEKIVQYLKLYKAPPKNGLAVFCGNISPEAAKSDIQLFSLEPPAPIKNNIYRCDSQFLLEPLEAMMESTEAYALVVMDGRDATVGLLKGTHFILEKRLHSTAHAKIRKGGQSMNRYQRLIEESIEDYYKRIGESINDLYAKNSFKLKGLLVGGSGPAKEDFVKAKTLNYQVKVLGVFDTGYTDEIVGVNELLEKARDVLEQQAAMQERSVMERFMGEIARNGLAVSGYDKVKKALESGNITKLIISEALELTEVHYRCTNGHELTAIEEGNTRKDKDACGASFAIVSQKDALDTLLDIADAKNLDVVFVSDDSQYGKQLLLGFGGIAAMLKYKG